MKKTWPLFFVFFLLLILISGCGDILNTIQNKYLYYDNRIPLSHHFQDKALEFEKKDEPRLALYYQKIAATFNPEDKEIEKKLNELKRKYTSEAEKHYQLGLLNIKNGISENAQREFLIALRYNPEHPNALKYVKTVSSPPVYSSYTIQKDDTFKKISVDSYKNAKLDFFIAEFNDLDAKAKPNPGLVIRVPIIETKYLELEPPPKILIKPEESKQKKEITGIDIEKELTESRNLFALGDYPNSLAASEKILQFDSSNTEAQELKNHAYLQMGLKYLNEKNYFPANTALNKVDQGFPGRDQALDEVKIRMIEEAEFHYRTGVNHFNNKKIRSAILEWAKALTYNPNHQKAKEDIEKARKLLKPKR